LTLSAARKAATAAQHEIEQGNDPAAGKQATRAAVQLTGLHTPDSVEVLAGQFIELHARRKVRPSTLYQYESIFHRLVLPVWPERSVHGVRRRDVIALVEAIADERGGYMANRTLGLLSKFFAWLMARDIVAVSPVHGVERPHKEVARDRALSDDEVARLWAACGDEGVFGAAIRMMVLTGCRRREVAEMRWDEVDAERRLWTLPAARSKSRHSLAAPLVPAAWDVISSVPRIGDYVFSTTGDRPIANFVRVKSRLDAKLKLAQHWRIHDTRRSVASGLQRLGLQVEIIEAVLGHLSGTRAGIVGVYQRHDFAEEKRVALERWADHIAQISSGKTAKVVPLRGRR
jgi:integrase